MPKIRDQNGYEQVERDPTPEPLTAAPSYGDDTTPGGADTVPLRSFPVLRSAVELFATQDRHRTSEIRVFRELVGRYLSQASTADRRYVAALLAARSDAPAEVIRSLAHDHPTIAAPLLARSPILTPQDLLTLCRTGTAGHRLAITARTDLTIEVVEALLDAGDDGLFEKLVSNPSAPLPPSARKDLVKHAAERPEEVATFARRQDTDAETLAQLFMNLSGELRTRALMICEARTALEAALPGADQVSDPAQKDYRDDLERSAFNGDKEGFRKLLAEATGLSLAQIESILADPGGEALVVLLASVDLDEALMVRIFLFAAPHLGNDNATIKRLADLRADISTRTAAFIVRQWQSNAQLGETRQKEMSVRTSEPDRALASRRTTPLVDRKLETTPQPLPKGIAASPFVSILTGRRRQSKSG